MNIFNVTISLITSYDMGEMVLKYVWIPICTPLIIALGKFVISDKLVYVREIKKITDADIDSFKDLYNKRIAEKYRICVEEILSFLGNNTSSAVQHHLYICKKWNKTIGFIKFMVSKPQKYIFVAYVAIDDEDITAKRYGLKVLIKVVLKKYFKQDKIDKVLIEAEKAGDGRPYSAYAKLISRYATANKKKAYIYNFDYIQPNMPDDNYNIVSEEYMTLVVIPYYKPSHLIINKSSLLELIRMIYFDIYCPSCNSITNCCEVDYGQYLNKIIKSYANDLPDDIEILCLEKD